MESWSHSRRSLLRAAAGISTAGIAAGCTVLSGETEEWHEVTVVNSIREANTYRVRITGEANGVLADEEFDLPADKVDSFAFQGTPAAVEIEIDDSRTHEFQWAPMTDDNYRELHPDGCRRQSTTSLTFGLVNTEFHATFGCDSVRKNEQ